MLVKLDHFPRFRGENDKCFETTTLEQGNPCNGYINPYYWVDDHPLLYIHIYTYTYIYIYTWKHWQTTTSLTTPSHPYNPQVNPLNPCLFVQELASFVNIPLPSFITRVLGRGAPSNTSKKATALTHVRHEEFKNQVIQGDLLIPQLEVTIRPLKGSFNHPKKVTKNCQKHIFLV